MVIFDDSELFNGMEFQGTENVRISIGTADADHTEVILEKKFIMTGIESQTKSGESGLSLIHI